MFSLCKYSCAFLSVRLLIGKVLMTSGIQQRCFLKLFRGTVSVLLGKTPVTASRVNSMSEHEIAVCFIWNTMSSFLLLPFHSLCQNDYYLCIIYCFYALIESPVHRGKANIFWLVACNILPDFFLCAHESFPCSSRLPSGRESITVTLTARVWFAWTSWRTTGVRPSPSLKSSSPSARCSRTATLVRHLTSILKWELAKTPTSPLPNLLSRPPLNSHYYIIKT